MNKCFFIGRTTSDITLKTTSNGTTYAKFSLAVDTGYGDNQKTSFLNMTAWNKMAETLSKYVPKGRKILVECEALQNQYKDKNGNNVNTVDFRVFDMEFCENKKDSNQKSNPEKAADDGFMNIAEDNGEELPFN